MKSKQLLARFDAPQSAGRFTQEHAREKGMRLAIGEAGERTRGNWVRFHLLVDTSDGVVADCKVQLFGDPFLIAAAEVACELILRKTYDQAMRMGAELIDRHVRAHGELAAFPDEAAHHLNLVLEAIERAAHSCMDIPLSDSFAASPLEELEGEKASIYPGWGTLSLAQRVSVIEEVIASEIRPYIALDAGDIQVRNLSPEGELLIAYSGSCTTCYAATGSTLDAIQNILRTRVHPGITVTPDMSFLSAPTYELG